MESKIRAWSPPDAENSPVLLKLQNSADGDFVDVALVNDKGLAQSGGIVLRICSEGFYRMGAANPDLGIALGDKHKIQELGQWPPS